MNSEKIKKILPTQISKWARNRGIRSVSTLKYVLLFDHYLQKSPPIYVYQMGKVGSMSIYKSLLRQYPGIVLQAHNFRADNEDIMVQKLHHYTFTQKKPLKVISLTREPVGRAISSFFQNFFRDTGLMLEDQHYETEELKQLFLDKHDHYYALKWFDNNIKKNFGIDVFSEPFPKDLGYKIYNNDNVDLLVLQSELDDARKQAIVREYLGFEGFLLKNENIGKEKVYSQTYNKFKSEVRLPEKYINYLCKSTYFNQFYDDKTYQKILTRWVEHAV